MKSELMISYHVDIERNGIVEKSFEYEYFSVFMPGNKDTASIIQNWLPTLTGDYEIKHYAGSSLIESVPENDTLTHNFSLTDSLLTPTDFDKINYYIHPYFYNNGALDNGDGLGFFVNIPSPGLHGDESDYYSLNGLVFFFNGTRVEEEISLVESGEAKAIARVYRYDTINNSFQLVIESNEKVLSIMDTMSRVYIPFPENNSGKFISDEGKYLVMLHFMGIYYETLNPNTWTIGRYVDPSDRYSMEMCVFGQHEISSMNDLYFIDAKPAIALDVSFSQPYVGFTKLIKNEIGVYPNPTSGLITIETNENSEITIQNMAGQVCFKNQINSSEQIDLSHLPKGVYVVNAISANGQASETLIIQ
jgi:hypothetical protein